MKVTKGVRKLVCVLLTTTIVFTNTEMTIFAEKSVQIQENAQTEDSLIEWD